jgi:hypothetical protein
VTFIDMSAPLGRGSAPRLNILVEAEEVRWIVFGLEIDEALVIAPKRRPN